MTASSDNTVGYCVFLNSADRHLARVEYAAGSWEAKFTRKRIAVLRAAIAKHTA
jgi:hypothetical protein